MPFAQAGVRGAEGAAGEAAQSVRARRLEAAMRIRSS